MKSKVPSTDILLVGINYEPEPSGNAPYTAGLARGLRRLGVRTSVLTGFPHYPAWKRYDGYAGWSIQETMDDVPVQRLRHFIPRRPRLLTRLLMETTFGIRCAFARWNSPKAVLLISPALFASGIALIRARTLRDRPSVAIWVQDLYSLGVSETGLSGSFGARLAKFVESRILRGADGLIVIHERFKSHLITHLGVPADRVKVIRNWTHLRPFELNDRKASRESFGWDPSEIIVLHAGNMGAKQGLENVIEAAKMPEAKRQHIRFVLVGDGNQRSRLEALAVGVDQVTFLSSLPGSRFQEALASADVLLVNELPGVREMSVPSKLTSYFSAGVPVLAATDPSSVTAEEIGATGTGLRVDPGDPAALLAGIQALYDDQALQKQLTENARRFMTSLLSEEYAVSQYDQYMKRLSGASA